MKAIFAVWLLLACVAFWAATVPPPSTPCTAMHRQLIVIGRVDANGQFVSTPIVVDVCDKANVAYLEPK